MMITSAAAIIAAAAKTAPGRAALWALAAVLGALAALACGEGALPVDPDAASVRAAAGAMREGNAAFAREEFRDAMDAYDRAAESMPEDPRPVYNSANALYKQNRLFEAIDKYEDALKKAEPDFASDIYSSMCRAILDSGDPEGAIESCENALEIDPDNQIAKRALEEATEADDPPPDEQAQQPGQQGDEQPQPGGDQNQQPQPGGDQQQRQPNQQPGGDQQQQPQPGGDQMPQDRTDDEEPGEGGGNPGEPTGESSGADGGDPVMVPPTGLTEEQARQLLEAAGDQTNTLPRRSWDDIRSGSGTERDW